MPITIIGKRPLLPYQTTIELPYSKSIGIRQLLIAYLRNEPLPLLDAGEEAHFLFCDDLLVFYNALKELRGKASYEVITLECGSSATTMRFFIVLALYRQSLTKLEGSQQLLNRIAKDDLDFIKQIGGDYYIVPERGYINIRPPKKLRDTHIVSNWHTNQYLSAFAICNEFYKEQITFDIDTLKTSFSYFQLTQEILKKVELKGLERDWSAAAFWYQLLASSPTLKQITLPGLTLNSPQPDSRIASIFSLFGVETIQNKDAVVVRKPRKRTLPKKIDLDLSNNLDLFIPLALTTFTLGIPFTFTGIEPLRRKESDRLTTFQNIILSYYEAIFTTTINSISWDGSKENITKVAVELPPSYDHRIAMGSTMFALTQPTTTHIPDADAFTKSYPSFFNDIEKIIHN